MTDQPIPIRHAQFSEAEVAALQALHRKYRSLPYLFTARELAYLHFMRWLVRRRGWHRAPEQPMSVQPS